MYKVFINEKKILLSKEKVNLEKSIEYTNKNDLENAIELLENTSCKEINIYYENIDQLWSDFKLLSKNIDAAGGIVKNTKNEILFIERLGRWDLPKGKAEKGEKIEETAIREVEEETNINKVKIVDFIGCTYHIYITKTKKKRMLKTTYWYAMEYKGNRQGKPQVKEGITAISWKNNQDIEREVLPNTFENIIYILEEYRKKIK